MSKLKIEAPYFGAPEQFDNDYDALAYESLANTTYRELINDMPDEFCYAEDMWGAYGVYFHDIAADDEYDHTKALVVPFDYGEGYTPATHLRVKAIQSFMKQKTRVLAFPNNMTRSDAVYDIGRIGQNDAVESLGHIILGACQQLGIEDVVISGYGQGASVGASMIVDSHNYDVNVVAAYLSEPLDIKNRTTQELVEDLSKNTSQDLFRSTNDAGIPVLDRVKNTRGITDRLRQLPLSRERKMASLIFDNSLLLESLAEDRFVSNIVKSITEFKIDSHALQIARMGFSYACDFNLDLSLERNMLKDKLTVVSGYGHEGGENIIDNAIRTSRVIETSDFFRY